MQIYGDLVSGNCLKVKFIADYLGLEYRWEPVDVLAGAAKTDAFRKINPAGQVPVVRWPDGRALAQSNAILLYLAEGSELLPSDPFRRAQMHSWLFWEQYSHEPYVAVCRFQMVYLKKAASERESWRVDKGEEALDILEMQAGHTDWLVGDQLSVADISLVAYTRMAADGGFELGRRPGVKRWIERVEGALGLEPYAP